MDINNTKNIKVTIERFIQGNASDKEHKMLLEWLEKNPENKKLLFGEKDLWESTLIGSVRLNEIEEQQWIELQKRISVSKTKSFRFKEIIRIAASVIIALGIGWMGHYLYSSGTFSKEQVELKHIEASKGQIKEIFLADGTHVWLNSDSKFSFPSNFTEDSREVELQGEAYFEVTSSEENPFTVKTKNHTVKVTGTKFNICEYPESNIIETTLVEGKVKILTGNIIRDLKPGHQSTFYARTAEILIGEKDFEIYTAWKDGRYEFRNETVEKITSIVERWWDVEIIFQDDKLKSDRFSGVLRKHKPLEQHLDAFKQVMHFDYNIEKDIVRIN